MFGEVAVSVSVSLSLCLSVSLSLCLSVSLSLSLSLSSWGLQGRAESEKGLSSPVPDQQRSILCVCFVPHPLHCVIAHTLRQHAWFHSRSPRNVERRRRSPVTPPIRCIRRQTSGLWTHRRRWRHWPVSTWSYHDRQFEEQPNGTVRRLRSQLRAHHRIRSGGHHHVSVRDPQSMEWMPLG